MANGATVRRVARINKEEILDLPREWTQEEKGRYLRYILQFKGIDCARLYQIEYFPHHRCWVLTQEGDRRPRSSCSPPGDEEFYRQTIQEFRRTARAACATLAARSTHFASFGCRYELPPPAQELTPMGLAKLLSEKDRAEPSVRFDSEGGWHLD
jgi:hypothetical protein